MKKIVFLIIAFAVFFVGCDDMLDTDNYTKSNTSNFPATESDVEMALTAVYSILNKMTCNPVQSYFFVSEFASDDRFGAGGTGDLECTAIGHLLQSSNTMFDNFWEVMYMGVYRANTVIETIDNCEWSSEENRNQALGEAYYMRAFFYQQLTEMWGEVPLVVSTVVEDMPVSTADEIYAQITSDLVNAINLMLDKPYSSYTSGHATKWAAEGMLARNFLFYTGFYSKESLPTVDGGTVSKSDVVTYLKDCVTNSGHELVGDFRNLWPYTNEFTIKDYDYTSVLNTDSTRSVKTGVDGKTLAWAGNGNKEEMFAVQYMNYAGWNDSYQMGYSNQYILYQGLRCSDNGYENTFPFGQGWGQGSISTNLWDDWKTAEPYDTIRREGSIIDCQNELDGYVFVSDCDEDSGYALKKMQPVTCKYNADGDTLDFDTKNIFWTCMDGYTSSSNGNAMQGAHYQDLILLRYADILLMLSELTEDAQYMNLVRNRVGLSDIAYSEDALRNERRWELVGEGRRWADIRRWGIAEDALSKQVGVNVNHETTWTKMPDVGDGFASRYQATKGFWPIPKTQIELSEYLEQNAGWGDTDNKTYNTSMWSN